MAEQIDVEKVKEKLREFYEIAKKNSNGAVSKGQAIKIFPGNSKIRKFVLEKGYIYRVKTPYMEPFYVMSPKAVEDNMIIII